MSASWPRTRSDASQSPKRLPRRSSGWPHANRATSLESHCRLMAGISQLDPRSTAHTTTAERIRGPNTMERFERPPPTVTIGKDLTVDAIGYGAMQLTGPKVWGEYPDRDKAIALLREVVAEGVTYIDTADVYGPHSNEELIREAFHPYPAHPVIATKSAL